MIYERKAQDIWNFIGSAWDNFEDKTTVEAYWSAIGSGVDQMMGYLFNAQKSRSMNYLSEIVESGPVSFDIVYSGVNQNTLEHGFSFEYPVETWTASIPVLYQDYKYGVISGLNIYTEGVHYTVSGYNYLVWNMTSPPTPDPRYTVSKMIHVYAPNVYRLNPVLMSVWARALGLSMTHFGNYSLFQASNTLATRARHLKYFIWALTYYKSRPPTIKNLKLAYGVSHGMPFAYNSGIASTSGSTVTCGGYTYTLTGLIPVANGTVVKQFDLLASGLSLWDNYSNPSLIASYANRMSIGNTLLFQVSAAVSGLAHDTYFSEMYMSDVMPLQLQYYII